MRPLSLALVVAVAAACTDDKPAPQPLPAETGPSAVQETEPNDDSNTAQADVMLSTAVPLNYRVPHGSDEQDWTWEENRLCAYGSEHAGGVNFALADGSARFIADSISLETLQALSTREGEEVVEAP